jgi:hypothetical protein
MRRLLHVHLHQIVGSFAACSITGLLGPHESALDRMGAVNHVAPLSVARIAASLVSA